MEDSYWEDISAQNGVHNGNSSYLASSIKAKTTVEHLNSMANFLNEVKLLYIVM